MQTVLGYPVVGEVEFKKIGKMIPLVDIPMMSDEKWEQLCTENAINNYTRELGRTPESPEIAVKWQREWIAGMDKAVAISQQKEEHKADED